MKKNILFVVVCFLVLSCNNTKKTDKETDQSPIPKDTISPIANKSKIVNPSTIYFKATGTEPFWGLEISEDRIVLKTMEDTIITPYAKPIKAADANVKSYRLETEANNLNIQISHKECVNAMSGKNFPYTVTISYKKTGEANFKIIEGCGHYITDYRLHDIWILESLNGKQITEADFSKEFPNMEINTSDNRFMGFAGCNRMNGQLFFEKGLLRFTNTVITKMMCSYNNKESEFLKALQSATTYSISNNHLKLSNPNGTLLEFKKVD
ncbi:META domain-containing protein [Flavobacteriaceae bacterium XHP0103]|uniref:META domain-containing protein n=1 Tax=Marixanthotalea marina TaxID=2844359 RepID=UPI002989D996|nr:META domain-containing protein [Marixanthotalea marina]MBU3821526.1 META domain-containing protein [Marixanthotalea marina]